MIVKFATLCDKCNRRSEEYSAWPTCRACMEHICDNCDVKSQRSEDELCMTMCKACYDDYMSEQVPEMCADGTCGKCDKCDARSESECSNYDIEMRGK